jgi:predicted adenine nucleotide alpha hydrolase (AANH) superfamily ATPase
VVRGYEQAPENGARCPRCYRFRLEAAASYAAANGYAVFASTLTTGPRKPAAVIDPIGTAAGERFGVTFLGRDWKKQDGFALSCRLSRSLGIYRQHYCGCRFSMQVGGE